MTRIVILEGDAVDPGDIGWGPVEALGETIVHHNTTEEDKWEHIGDADAVLTNKVVIDEAVFERFPRIRYVGVCATGYDVVDVEAARRRGVVVTNVPAYGTRSVVQHTWALLLELASKTAVHAGSVRRGDWTRSKTFCYWLEPTVELAGKTMGIYGFGNTGRGVADVALAMGLDVVVRTLHPEKYAPRADGRLRFVDEDAFFRVPDVLSFHCPLTPATRGLVCAANLAKAKDGVYVLNVSRGPVVVEQDLADALRSGKVAGAGLDVVCAEPMAPDNPLIGAPNLVVTPHIAWASREARRRLVGIVAANLRAFLDGTPRNAVAWPGRR